MHKERVLVTGATGLLGANLVCELNKQGYNVRILARENSNLTPLADCKYELYKGNINDVWSLERAIQECDYIIHSAAKTVQKPTKLKYFTEENINATAYLLQLSKKHKIKRFIYVSTANCFTNGTINNPGTENSDFMPWLKKSGYAYSKYLAQRMILDEVKNNDFPAIIVAPTFMLGQRDSKPSSGKLLMHGLKSKFIFFPKGGKSFVDVDYAAEAIVNSLSKGKIGESYIISGENISYKDFYKKVKIISGSKKILIQVPTPLLIAIAAILDTFEKIFGISMPLNRVNQKLLNLENYFSNKKAVAELDLKQSSTDLSIKKAIKWFKKNKMI